ncbi:MAG: type VI secretion system secreted protein VgrG [Oceanicoccus sp.]|jgi:type VI secretion system secreted protein VgrG
MPPLSQHNRLLRIDTPLGKDIFVAKALYGEEAISEIFQFSIEMRAVETDIAAADMVGQKVTASIHYNTENTRYINGIVSQFSAYGLVEGVRRYTAIIVPTLWLLTLNQSSKMYSGKTTKDIVSDLLKPAGVEFKYNAAANDKREYCIQYQETDFDFFSRLLAEEGLSYYFVHSSGKHELIIVDKNTQYVDCAEKKVECDDADNGGSSLLSRVTQWQRQYQMHTGKLALTGYLESDAGKGQNTKVTTKNKILKNISKYQRSFHESAVPFKLNKEMPDYGAKITQKKTAELILETEEASFDIATGGGNCCTFLAGGRFELDHRSLTSESGKYLLVRVNHQVIDKNSVTEYTNNFSCVPSTTPVHPAPPGNRMRIHGPHLATVLDVKAGDSPGSSDPQLMVKIRFYWDEDEQSCWVRVMQNYAGPGEGAVFVPRIDSEVVVEFVGGDPDRPLITGAVYNSKNKAPEYSKTQSGFKTDEGGKFNEFRFDGKKGDEEIYMEAGKDHNFLIHNDETGEIKNNQTLKVIKDRKRTVDGKEDVDVKGNQTVKVEGNQAVEVKGNQTGKVTGNQTDKVTGNRTDKVTGSHTLDVTGASTYKSKKTITISATTSITLKVGGSKIVIDNSGITMKGPKIEAKASASAKLEGGGMVDVKAGGIMNIKGSLVKIN